MSVGVHCCSNDVRGLWRSRSIDQHGQNCRPRVHSRGVSHCRSTEAIENLSADRIGKPLSPSEQALQSAIDPFLEELAQLGYRVFGAYRIALVGSSGETVLRAKFSDGYGAFVVDSPAPPTFDKHKFENADSAIQFLVDRARRRTADHE
jgi:hypothetical protein